MLAVCPTVTDWFAGSVVIDGGSLTRVGDRKVGAVEHLLYATVMTTSTPKSSCVIVAFDGIRPVETR